MKRKLLTTLLSALLIISTTAVTAFASDSVENADIDMMKQSSYQQETEISATVDTSLTVTVPKRVVLDNSVRVMNIEVNTRGDIPGTTKVIVKPSVTDFNLSSPGKADVNAHINFTDITWNYIDAAVRENDVLVGTTRVGNITYGELTAGKWRGTFDFDISINDESAEADINPDELERGTFTYNDLKNAGVNVVGDITVPQYAKLNGEYKLVSSVDLRDATAEEKLAITGLTEEVPGQLYDLSGLAGTGIVELTFPMNSQFCTIENMPKLEKLVMGGDNYYFSGPTDIESGSLLPELREVYILNNTGNTGGNITGFIGLPKLEKVVIERGMLYETPIYEVVDGYDKFTGEYAGCFSNCPNLTDVTVYDKYYDTWATEAVDTVDYILENKPFDNTPWKDNLKRSRTVRLVSGYGDVTVIDNADILNDYKSETGTIKYEIWNGDYKYATEDNLVAAFRFGGGLAFVGDIVDSIGQSAKLYKAHFVTAEKLSKNAKILEVQWTNTGYRLCEICPSSGFSYLGYTITEDGFDIIRGNRDSVSETVFIIVDEK